MSKRLTHSPEYKAKGPMEAICGRKTLQEIAADNPIYSFTFPGLPWLTNCCVHWVRAGEQAR